MQAIPSFPVPAKSPRVSEYWLLVPVVLAAAAAAWWPASPPAVVEMAMAPQPAMAAVSAANNDASVPAASTVTFKDDTLAEPAPTF
ncbi:MAG: hypothetical protein ABIP49_08685 [Lysobacterales bacterium]